MGDADMPGDSFLSKLKPILCIMFGLSGFGNKDTVLLHVVN